MLPDIDVRLRNIAKAIEQVILPVIPSHEKLAREQASIALGHLRVLQHQWKYALAAEQASRDNMLDLATKLRPYLSSAEIAEMNAAIAFAQGADATDYDQLHSAVLRLGTAVDTVVAVSRSHAADEAAVAKLVFGHAHHQARIERSWFASTGLDPASDLPSIPDMLAREARISE